MSRVLSRWSLPITIALAAIAYLPAVNNGFIADDYVILARVEVLKTEPLYLFNVPPDNFRLTIQLVFAAAKFLAGYRAPVFYVFGIAFHLINIILLRRLLHLATRDEFVADVGALLFALFQAPNEAVFWLTGMSETTLAFFALLTLLMWWQDRYIAATVFYLLALWSKESAVVLLLMIGLLDIHRKRRLIRAHFLLLIPTAVSAVVFFYTLARNSMVRSDAYQLTPQALVVLGMTLHRLIWPWLYIILFLVWLKWRKLPQVRDLAIYGACVLVPILPYMFITYQMTLPSRQLYLASAVLMAVFAILLKPLERTKLLPAFIVAFVASNIGYLWTRTDVQFQKRAAPTTALVETLRQRTPEPTLILNFPSQYPEIAYMAIWAVPGWKPNMVVVERTEVCPDCRRLTWNPATLNYE